MPDWTEYLRPRLAVLQLSPSRESEIIEVGLMRLRGHTSKGRCDQVPTTAPTSPETR